MYTDHVGDDLGEAAFAHVRIGNRRSFVRMESSHLDGRSAAPRYCCGRSRFTVEEVSQYKAGDATRLYRPELVEVL